ncbi:MAG: N-6 DNA methylase [Planctomycetaceae bacterium]|jgi:type I restriction-modification system DNA methylase subunit|nr:N-6 DNA methylase [Planctomycetaceae bacterium]
MKIKSDKINLLRKLVELFSSNIAQYKSGQYDESNVRVDFIDKFFELLDWDVRNEQGFSETHREVIREFKIKKSGGQKVPDYCFRISPSQFFVEAKKPTINIKENAESAIQLRRYAYTAKLPLSILTNFEEFAVYDTRIKINKNDWASTARIFYCTFNEYEQHFDYIYNMFSKIAIQKGSFEHYVNENKKVKGVSEVDKEFLNFIEGWRIELAKNIVLNNPELSIFDINISVQKIIDRLLFLRIAEDKGIESYGILQKESQKPSVYKHLNRIFSEADEKYNAGLFKHEKWLERISIDDKILYNIINSLYFPECPYALGVLPVEILGNIYEKFLGNVIRFTAGHRVKLEAKPEVRKAGGVFYTPQYIVDYIVQNTVGVLINNKTLEEISKITIIDPACGSGSFLVGAYQFLLNYHLDFYTRAANKKSALRRDKIFESGSQTYKLTIAEKQRILQNNIFGVDIDSQAVEVTKLSLYLKLLENEGKESEGQLFSFADLRLLPDIDNNIKCGNSLIGTDFFAQQNFNLTEDEQLKINCFDWEKEFSNIFKNNGGFDIVIGNPPYTYLISEKVQNYFKKTYQYQNYQKDLYLIFLEKYATLLKHGGSFGVIVSNTWLSSITYRKIRQHMISNYRWRKILYLPEKVFKDAVVDTHILIFDRTTPKDKNICDVEIYRDKTVLPMNKIRFSDLPQDGLPINITANPKKRILFNKITKQCRQLKDYCNVYNGIKPFEKGKGKPPQSERAVKEKPYVFEGKKPAGKNWLPLLRGSLIHRYINRWDNNYWVQYGEWLAAPRDPAIFDAKNKIIVRQTGESLIATHIGQGIICRNNLHIIISNSKFNLLFFLALINSKLMNFVYEIMNPEKGEALAEVKKIHVEQLPIPLLDPSQKTNKTKYDKIISLANKMLQLKIKELAEQKTQMKTILQRQIKALDQQINQAVYLLYDLSEEEIKIIEGE